MPRFRRLLVGSFLLAWLCPAGAAPAETTLPHGVPNGASSGLPEGLADGGRATAVEIVDGDTLLLDDGREVRLVGLQAPKLPLGRPGFEAWPLSDAAKEALDDIAGGQRLRLGYGGRRTDRHGRDLAHLYRDDGLWLQGALLESGMARVYSFADNRALVAEMLARERAARAARRGIWADPYYAVRTPFEAGDFIDSFQVIEGRVRAVAVVRGRAYLNFGEDWRSDFTVSLAPAVLRRFAREGVDPAGYADRAVRVRGWLKSFNGPMIEATHPEQIEVLQE